MPGLTKFLDRVPPAQRQMLLLGVPVVAALVIARAVKKPSADQRDVPASSGVVPASDPNALGVGQLAAWESDWANALYDVQRSIADLEERGVSAPSPGPTQPADPPPPPPGPAPKPTDDPEPAVAAPASLRDVYGSIPTSQRRAMPTTDVAQSVKAPPGGKFVGGTWKGDVLVAATYKLPSGKTVRVRS